MCPSLELITIALVVCQILFFIPLDLELLAQFLAVNKEQHLYLIKIIRNDLFN